MWKRPRIKLNNFKIVQAMTIDFFSQNLCANILKHVNIEVTRATEF